MAMTPSIELLMLGRFLVGIAIGMASITVPVYLSEISPNEMRGTIVAFNNTMCPIGQFIANLVALQLRGNWRAMLGLAAVPSFVQLVGILAMPES